VGQPCVELDQACFTLSCFFCVGIIPYVEGGVEDDIFKS
jgi:hypothetical protein